MRHFVQEAFFFPDSVCPTFFGNVLREEVSSERVHRPQTFLFKMLLVSDLSIKH